MPQLCVAVAVLVFVAVPGLWAQSANVSVFASGFNNPRGLKFGPDGYLYVAEGGAGGSLSTIGLCKQVPDAGPYTGDFTARISKVAPNGAVSTVVEGLPSSQTNPDLAAWSAAWQTWPSSTASYTRFSPAQDAPMV
jgi:hypothetical protein